MVNNVNGQNRYFACYDLYGFTLIEVVYLCYKVMIPTIKFLMPFAFLANNVNVLVLVCIN